MSQVSARKNIQKGTKDNGPDDLDLDGRDVKVNRKMRQQEYRTSARGNSSTLPWMIAGAALLVIRLDGQPLGESLVTRSQRFPHGTFNLPAGKHTLRFSFDVVTNPPVTWSWRLDIDACTNPAGTIKIAGASPFAEVNCGDGYAVASPSVGQLSSVFALMDSCYAPRTSAWVAGYNGDAAKVGSGQCLTAVSGSGSGAAGAVVPAANCDLFIPAVCYKVGAQI
ncbi:hypothetical protein HDV00_008397 [Rhizophlyctis rosea]|nr:hypothetical protein HDV00_008397 [Rhizophlyctis rosea]